jgi:hypothetical protein
MDPYLFEGVVHPVRAPLSLKMTLAFTYLLSGIDAKADINILLNQVAVWIDSPVEWDIFDLRNVVKNILQNEIAVIGYIKGHAYEVEVTRVINRGLGIDYVFGIDIPCIVKRNESIDLDTRLALIRKKTEGIEGVLLHRCFNDLVAAMKNPEDTGFYCYRAIESLRQHCLKKYNIPPEEKATQWEKLREIAKCDEKTIKDIKAAADPVRHGGTLSITSEERDTLFLATWDIVDNYLINT